MTDQTIFERVAVAVDPWAFDPENYGSGASLGFRQSQATQTARAVIQTIIDNIGSPYTVDELTRILGEAT